MMSLIKDSEVYIGTALVVKTEICGKYRILK